MEKSLWYLFDGTPGGDRRARVVRALDERPRNANELAGELDLAYNTVRYHLDLLCEYGVVEAGEREYGRLYFLTDAFETHRDVFETITGEE